jgi:hypothetical protein
MSQAVKTFSFCVLLLPFFLSLTGCGCGFDCNDDDDDDPATVSLGFSDAPIDDVQEVVLVVDTITFRRSSGDVVVETFTIPKLSLTDAETFPVDLLEYPGTIRLLVITDLPMERGTYSSIVLDILDGDVNQSYVRDDEGAKPLNAPSSQLVLPGISVSAGAQSNTVEFSLGQSLLYQSSSDSYELTIEGIRVEDSDAGSIAGSVDSSLFDLDAPCDAKADPLLGNRVYLYSGINLGLDNLADVYTSNSSDSIPDDAIAPYAVADVVEAGGLPIRSYTFGFIPEGQYTLAFSCEAEDDDPVNYDGFRVPSPIGQRYEIDQADGEVTVCNLAVDASCS